MLPSSPPCFQHMSCCLCLFLQSHLAHVTFPTLLSGYELPPVLPQSYLAHVAFFPTLLSGCELQSVLIPLILSCSLCLLPHPAFRGWVTVCACSSNPIFLTSLSSPPCFQVVSYHLCLFLQSHLPHTTSLSHPAFGL